MMESIMERSDAMAGYDDAASRLKVCPQCGEKLFADMDVCYACLYDYRAAKSERGDQLMPGVGHGVTRRADDASRQGGGVPPMQAPAVAPAPAAAPASVTSADPPAQPMEPGASPAAADQGYLRVTTDGMDVMMPVPDGGLVVGPQDECDLVVRDPCRISICSR